MPFCSICDKGIYTNNEWNIVCHSCVERIQQFESELNQMASDAYDNFYWSELALYQARCALIWCDERIQQLEDALKIIRDGPHNEKCGYCLFYPSKAKQALEKFPEKPISSKPLD